MTIAVVDSGGANIASVMHALRRLGAEPQFTSEASAIRAADRVILPGVGAAASAMEKLNEKQLVKVIAELKQPVLGVCLGMQLLFERTEEGDVEMLGILPGRVRRLGGEKALRVPHMGWNKIEPDTNNYLCDKLPSYWFYFVHSYAAPTGAWTQATAHHGQRFSAMVRKDNFWGAQFHPERSAQSGALLLRNFLELDRT